MRSLPSVCTALLLAGAAHSCGAQDAARYVIPAGTPAHIVRAIESEERTAEQRARDYHREPAEILTLAGLEEGDRVIGLAAFRKSN